MPKYHVTNEGKICLCQASTLCPFGSFNQDHFATVGEAEKHYEKLNKAVYPINITHSQLSTFHRHGEFIMREGDKILLSKLEAEEYGRAGDSISKEQFSILELERIVDITNEKLSHLDDDSELTRGDRSILTRIIMVREKATTEAEQRRSDLCVKS